MGNILGSLGVCNVDIVSQEVKLFIKTISRWCYPGKAMIPMMMNCGVESIVEGAF